MKLIDHMRAMAKEIAVKPINFYPSSFLTVRFVKSLNITAGAVTFGRNHISVPVNIFCFNNFKDFNKRVIIDRQSMKVRRII